MGYRFGKVTLALVAEKPGFLQPRSPGDVVAWGCHGCGRVGMGGWVLKELFPSPTFDEVMGWAKGEYQSYIKLKREELRAGMPTRNSWLLNGVGGGLVWFGAGLLMNASLALNSFQVLGS